MGFWMSVVPPLAKVAQGLPQYIAGWDTSSALLVGCIGLLASTGPQKCAFLNKAIFQCNGMWLLPELPIGKNS